MSGKYKVLICIGILAVLFGFYGYKIGETRLASIPDPVPAKKQPKTVQVEKQAKSDDMVAAILIMPKSYLPALKRFSQSPMARNIKIMPAEVKIKDGKMTAVRKEEHVKPQKRQNKPANKPVAAPSLADSHLALDREKQIVSAGFLYLLSGISKSPFVR